MYNNGHLPSSRRAPFPPGQAPPARLRQVSKGSIESGEETPRAFEAPLELPLHRTVDEDLYASIEEHLRGLDVANVDPPGVDPSTGSLREPARVGTRSTSPVSNGVYPETETSIISLYENDDEPQRTIAAGDRYVPPIRTSSAAPDAPSPASTYRTASASPPASVSPVPGRRIGNRPLPPTPQTRTPSGGRPLSNVYESDSRTSSMYTPPTSHRAFSAGSPSSAGRLSVESSRTSSFSHNAHAPWYSPGSPVVTEPFDPTTGRILRQTSYGLGPPFPLASSSSLEDGGLLKRGPLSTPPTSPPIPRASPDRFASSRTSHRKGATDTIARTALSREEPVLSRLNPALLSHIALFIKDRVARAEHTRGAIPYMNSFTGQDLVNTIQRALPDHLKEDRRIGLQIARSLHGQLFFFDTRDNTGLLYDNLDGVYVFCDEEQTVHDLGEGASTGPRRTLSLAEDIPTGVTTDVTRCYSPFCVRLSAAGKTGGCYSPSCPNSSAAKLQRQSSAWSERPATASTTASSDVPWVATVPAELLTLLGETEVKRQNEMHELITGETDYVRDIDILRTEFLEPLSESDPPIIPADDLSAFLAEVLLNAFEIREHANAFAEALQHRQREQGPVIQSIGDVVLAAATDWSLAYMRYATEYPFAEARVKRERVTNPAFDTFMNTFSRRPATRKLSMLHYQTRITVRLQRYILLLDNIRKHTPVENTDRESLEEAVLTLTNQCKRADDGIAASTLRLACREYERDLVERPGTAYIKDLELLDEERTIVNRGRMLRKPEGGAFTDWTELFIILLDNYFIMTKPRAQGRTGDTKYHISRRPVPLELLTLYSYDDSPVPRSSGFHIGSRNTYGGENGVRDDRLLWPMTLQYSGRGGGIFTLYAESSRSREDWRERLQEAINKRLAFLGRQRVLEIVPLCHDAFFMRQHAHETSTLRDGLKSVGRPACSVAFQTPEGHQLVAIGHEDGLWIGLRHDPSSFRLVLHLRMITQCAVLQDFALVLVLADKALYAYPLEALVPSAASSAIQRDKEPQKLSGAKDVLFFKAGKVGPRLLVIYVKKSGVNQTVFKALEPIAPNERSKATLLKRRPDWFRTYKDFFCPSETFSIIFLRSQLSIVCARGFELISLEVEPLKMSSFPDWPLIARNDARSGELAKRCSESRAVAMFRLDDAEFLFVYEDLAIYSDKHGDPIPSRYDDTIEWHGRPRHVAFIRPYLVAFDASFIEVRHAFSGKLVQIIKARDICCTFDGLAGIGLGTGESERRPHFTFQHAGRHIVAELVPIDSRGA